MTLILDRRTILAGSLFGFGAMTMPAMANVIFANGFTHSVASGEPTANSILLWTRYVSPNDEMLRCEIASDIGFTKIISGGEVMALGSKDHCAKINVTGLAPDNWYYFRFIAANGTISPIGRTRTLPIGDVKRFAIGLFSCSNLPFGYFNAYAHAAQRDDLDLIIHVGDYFYEYQRGTYPSAADALPARVIQPDHETITLADYRLRYASYRADPDLQRLHQLYPMIAQWDDHELTNDAWKDGAQNHQPETEGDWDVRKTIAERVYSEWMPVSGEAYNSYEIGNLATIIRPETRITGRMEQLNLDDYIKGQDNISAAIANFRDGAWQDKGRTLLGMQQEKWLNNIMGQSAKSGTAWQILAQQVIMGTLKSPPEIANWLPDGAPEYIKKRVITGIEASKSGLPFNFDAWDGYPAARDRLLANAQEANANLVVLAGDSHNAWGNNLVHNGKAAGVEFAGHGVTSPGFESYFTGVDPKTMADKLRAANPNLAFVDTSKRGYVSLDIRQERITGTWHFMSDIKSRNINISSEHSLSVMRGENILKKA